MAKKPTATEKGEEEKVPTKAEEKQIQIIERVIENREIAPHDAFGKLNRAQIELIKQTYAKGATDNELKLFISVCHGLQLSPFSKQVHLVPRWDSKTGKEIRQIQVGIDGLRATAEKTGKYAGNDDAEFDGEKSIEYTMGKEKRVANAPLKAKVVVYKIVEGQRYPFSATARWDEYYPGEKMGFQWHVRPHVMLAKCAEALALRKAFPALLSGIYAPEEMDRGQSENTEGQRVNEAMNMVQTMIKQASLVELNDYSAKLKKSDKYNAAQKAELQKLIDARITELSTDEIPVIEE